MLNDVYHRIDNNRILMSYNYGYCVRLQSITQSPIYIELYFYNLSQNKKICVTYSLPINFNKFLVYPFDVSNGQLGSRSKRPIIVLYCALYLHVNTIRTHFKERCPVLTCTRDAKNSWNKNFLRFISYGCFLFFSRN